LSARDPAGEITMSIGGLLIVILVVIVGWLVLIYNRLVALKNRVANAYAQIDVQLKRRHDLIPNLLEVARKYMSHERETLEAVVAARNRAVAAQGAAARDPTDAGAVASVGAAEAALGGALGRLLMLSESYPELKASTNMAQFAEELTSTENRVAFARQAFNDAVMALNTAIEAFPAVLFSGAVGFKAAGMLEAVESPTERAAPAVKF
jgi:LemA protein